MLLIERIKKSLPYCLKYKKVIILFLNTPPLFLFMYVYLYTHVKVTSFPFLLYALYVFVGNWCNIKQTCGDISTKKTIETKVSDEVVLED